MGWVPYFATRELVWTWSRWFQAYTVFVLTMASRIESVLDGTSSSRTIFTLPFWACHGVFEWGSCKLEGGGLVTPEKMCTIWKTEVLPVTFIQFIGALNGDAALERGRLRCIGGTIAAFAGSCVEGWSKKGGYGVLRFRYRLINFRCAWLIKAPQFARSMASIA